MKRQQSVVGKSEAEKRRLIHFNAAVEQVQNLIRISESMISVGDMLTAKMGRHFPVREL